MIVQLTRGTPDLFSAGSDAQGSAESSIFFMGSQNAVSERYTVCMSAVNVMTLKRNSMN